jgi:hypothetical protein
MRVIDEMLRELTSLSYDWNNGELTTEERNLKLDLLTKQVELLQIDFRYHPLDGLDTNVKAVLINLLSRHKHKAKNGLNALKEDDRKASYNRKVRYLIGNKLFFLSLNTTMIRNISSWKERNRMKHVKEFQIFILESEGVSNE